MFTYYLILIGLLLFAVGVGILGGWLRRHPSKHNAEKSSRIMHFLFFAGMGMPFLIGVFYPGLTHFDELVGLKSLPWRTFFLVLGIILAIPGLYLLAITNKLLRALGAGQSLPLDEANRCRGYIQAYTKPNVIGILFMDPCHGTRFEFDLYDTRRSLGLDSCACLFPQIFRGT